MKARDRFKTARGDITAYALACGYTQERYMSPGVHITLWHEGGPMYHVRAHDHAAGTRLFWHTTPSLKEARAVYRLGRAPQ